MKTLLKQLRNHHIILVLIFFITFIFRFPSLFEPYWYGDEGIFAAVARNLNFGGVLYADAWDNKPPMIYLTYQAIFNLFGVSMFWLKLTTAVVVLATCAVIYEIAQSTLGTKRALFAAFLFGFLTSLRIVEGNLALTEIYMILPTSLAMLFTVKRKFDPLSLFGAGVLFAIASLYKQVGAFEVVALGLFLFFKFFRGNELLDKKNWIAFLKKTWLLVAGFAVPYVLTVLYFAPRGLLDDYIFAAYTYYRIYFGESPRYAVFLNVLKYVPVLSAIWYAWRKRLGGKVEVFHLFLFWSAFSFLGAYFSGRTYGHYLVQAAPAVSLLATSISTKFKFTRDQLIFGVLFFGSIVFLTKLLFADFLSGGPLNQVSYWRNFIEFSAGSKNLDEYNNFFDGNVNTILALSDFFAMQNAKGASAYIWGDYPWLYAIADLKNPTKYVTSFHVFGVPQGRTEVSEDLSQNPPDFIIKPQSSIGYFSELEKFIGAGYTPLLTVEKTQIFTKSF